MKEDKKEGRKEDKGRKVDERRQVKEGRTMSEGRKEDEGRKEGRKEDEVKEDKTTDEGCCKRQMSSMSALRPSLVVSPAPPPSFNFRQ